MKFSTGIILSALAFNVFAATPTNINPGPLLDRRDAKPTMTDPLWKRNGDDDAEGDTPSPLRADAEASGGSSRSGRGGGSSRSGRGGGDRSYSPSRLRQLSNSITLNALVEKVYAKYQSTWTEERRREVLSFGQKLGAAAGKRASRKIGGKAGKFIGQEITMLLQLSLRFTNILVITSVRNDWPFKAASNLLDEMVSKAPEREKGRMKVGFVEKFEGIIAKSRDYAKLHRSLLEETAKTISGGTRDIALALKKASENAQEWAANTDTLVKTEFKSFLASVSKNPNSVSKVIETAQGYVNNIQLYAKLFAANSNKIAIMIRDPTKAEDLSKKVEEVKDNGAITDRRRGVKGRSSSASN